MLATLPRTRANALLIAVAALLFALCVGSATATAAEFNPERIISNDNMRAYDSMSVKEIQAFLETQPGPLAKLVTSDYDKVITLSKTKDNTNTTPDKGEDPKPASRIIWEACQAWSISPRVMLTMLQKEQSLISQVPLNPTKTLSRAIGAGVPGSLVDPKNNPVATNRYPGFGNQMWHGARLLSSYGEGNPSFPTYYVGMTKTIYKHPVYGTKIKPANLATFKLYVYNPSVPGNTNFYNIYTRYFGSPFAKPKMRPIYRFRNKANGTYLYTASIAERHKLKMPKYAKRWADSGKAFTWDSSVPQTQTVSVFRFKNKSTGRFSYTSSKKTYRARTSASGRRTWDYQGVAYRVARTASAGSVPVRQFKNRSTGGRLLTSSAKTAKRLRTDTTARRTWAYLGVAYHLPRTGSSQ